MRILWVISAVLGLGLTIHGCEETRMASAASATPQALTCAALSANGPGDNAHVTVTEFMVVEGDFVYEPSVDLEFKRIWLPLVPRAERAPAPKPDLLFGGGAAKRPRPSFRVLLESKHLPSTAAIEAFDATQNFTGLVINKIDGLDRETADLLREGYPGIDLETVWIVEHARSPTSSGAALALLGGGLAFLGLAAWLFRVRGSAAPKETYRRRHPRRMVQD